MTDWKWLARVMPAAEWMPRYSRVMFSGDLQAGITTAVMLIPQSMAYAMLAGLPPQIGLYASTVPLVLYALFGTSRQLAVGPVAVVSMMVAGALAGISAAASDPRVYVEMAILLMLLVGAVQLLMGLSRLGFLVNFLSHPVIVGFTFAAALIIGMSQLKHLLGIPSASGLQVHDVLIAMASNIHDLHWPTFIIGMTAIGLLIGLRRWRKTFPAALTVVALGTIGVWAFDLAEMGVKIVKDVPAGLPTPSAPSVSWNHVEMLLPTAIVISLVGFIESMAVAKAFASRNNYRIDANRELIALGLANLGGSLFRGYPVTGGFSRTAVNAQAGARTGMASIITACIVALTLFLFTPLFYYLPQAVLAAIIIVAVLGLIDLKEAQRIFAVRGIDGILMAITFVATLVVGIEEGIIVGVAASLATFVWRTTRPHVAILGRLPGTDTFRSIKRHPTALTESGIMIMRIDAPLYFGNVNFLQDTISDLESAHRPTPHRVLIIDASSINDLDSSAADALLEIAKDHRSRGIALYFAGAKSHVRDVMQRVKLTEFLGESAFPSRVSHAVQHWRESQTEGVVEPPVLGPQPAEPAPAPTEPA